MSTISSTEEQHRTQIHRVLESFETGDLDILDDVISEDHRMPQYEFIDGLEGMKAVIGRWNEGFSNIEQDVHDIAIDGDLGFLHYTFSAVHDGDMTFRLENGNTVNIPATGNDVEYQEMVKVTFDQDGKIATSDIISDEVRFFDQLGLLDLDDLLD